jgi:hypothetical protein
MLPRRMLISAELVILLLTSVVTVGITYRNNDKAYHFSYHNRFNEGDGLNIRHFSKTKTWR